MGRERCAQSAFVPDWRDYSIHGGSPPSSDDYASPQRAFGQNPKTGNKERFKRNQHKLALCFAHQIMTKILSLDLFLHVLFLLHLFAPCWDELTLNFKYIFYCHEYLVECTSFPLN